jgi:hypothetical protein
VVLALARRRTGSGVSGLYGKDPNGLEVEIVWLIDQSMEKERYGARTRGGVGISTPA